MNLAQAGSILNSRLKGGFSKTRSGLERAVLCSLLANLSLTQFLGCSYGSGSSRETVATYPDVRPPEERYGIPYRSFEWPETLQWSPRRKASDLNFYSKKISVSNLAELEAALGPQTEPVEITLQNPITVDREILVKAKDVLIKARSPYLENLDFAPTGAFLAEGQSIALSCSGSATAPYQVSLRIESPVRNFRLRSPKAPMHFALINMREIDQIMSDSSGNVLLGAAPSIDGEMDLDVHTDSLVYIKPSRTKELFYGQSEKYVAPHEFRITTASFASAARFVVDEGFLQLNPLGRVYPEFLVINGSTFIGGDLDKSHSFRSFCLDAESILRSQSLFYPEGFNRSVTRAHKAYEKVGSACIRGKWGQLIARDFNKCGGGQ